MNKAELINAIAAESGIGRAEAKKTLDAMLNTVTKSLKKGEKVTLVGFGTFYVNERAGRTGINPSTKQQIIIPAKKVVKFRPGSDLGEAIG